MGRRGEGEKREAEGVLRGSDEQQGADGQTKEVGRWEKKAVPSNQIGGKVRRDHNVMEGDMPTNTFRPPGGTVKKPYQRPVFVRAAPSRERAEELIREAREKEGRRRGMYDDLGAEELNN